MTSMRRRTWGTYGRNEAGTAGNRLTTYGWNEAGWGRNEAGYSREAAGYVRLG